MEAGSSAVETVDTVVGLPQGIGVGVSGHFLQLGAALFLLLAAAGCGLYRDIRDGAKAFKETAQSGQVIGREAKTTLKEAKPYLLGAAAALAAGLSAKYGTRAISARRKTTTVKEQRA